MIRLIGGPRDGERIDISAAHRKVVLRPPAGVAQDPDEKLAVYTVRRVATPDGGHERVGVIDGYRDAGGPDTAS